MQRVRVPAHVALVLVLFTVHAVVSLVLSLVDIPLFPALTRKHPVKSPSTQCVSALSVSASVVSAWGVLSPSV